MEFLELNRDIARNHLDSSQARVIADTLWGELKDTLNAHGPPINDVPGWKRVSTIGNYWFNRRQIIFFSN